MVMRTDHPGNITIVNFSDFVITAIITSVTTEVDMGSSKYGE